MFDIRTLLDDTYCAGTPEPAWACLEAEHAMDEAACMARWLPLAALDVGEAEQVRALATNAVLALRTQQPIFDVFSHLLQAYPLTTRAGCQLMALAEALLRTSDTATAQALLRDKLAGIDWVGEAGRVPAMDLAAIAQGLASVARVTRLPGPDEKESLGHALTRLVSEPVVLQGLRQGISGLAERFVMADTLEQALERADADLQYGIGHSFDMLGEAVLTSADAGICKDAYRHAIQVLGANRRRYADGLLSLSLKLSALHPRLEATQYARISEPLLADVLSLLEQARAQGVAVTLDAEENDRLELQLRVLERMLHSPGLRGWGGLGVAVQAYNRRAPAILGWLGRLSHACGCVIPVRLVKGAYWDSEVKLAQLRGLADYPVLTRKSATDVAYLGCARLLLGPALSARLRPRFATHNAHTSAAVIAMARRGGVSVEFEHLHGMGQDLHAYWRAHAGARTMVYAPVGDRKALLPYLVRRLLENGVAAAFVHRLADPRESVEALTADPLQQWRAETHAGGIPGIVAPTDLFKGHRRAAEMPNLAMTSVRAALVRHQAAWRSRVWRFMGDADESVQQTVCSPIDGHVVGRYATTPPEALDRLLSDAYAAFPMWNATSVALRAACLERLAEEYLAHRDELLSLCCREAGKTLQDGLDEIAEAVDFCRYYAEQARRLQGAPMDLPGPVGEANTLYWEGRGVFLCISPWNFPLAILTGQLCAALVTGNSVICKPASPVPLIALRVMECLHRAGVPKGVVHMLIGEGDRLGYPLLRDDRLAGVAFTGSTVTARRIQRALAERQGPLARLIAETGGQNAMIVDGTALPEQVVRDALHGAFVSAGQRCSALRLLCIPNESALMIERLLAGALAEWVVGDPADPATDSGPLINAQAAARIRSHVEVLEASSLRLGRAPLAQDLPDTFVAPVAYRIEDLDILLEEHFGPVLHVLRYDPADLDDLIEDINRLGYGLTLSIQSRNQSWARALEARLRVGNVYVNRHQVGARVGCQPFGGLGLSGTGPKAGGPHYLQAFCVERVRSENTAALGGVTELWVPS